VTEKKKRKLFTGGSVVRVSNARPDYRTKMSDNAKNKEVIYYPEEPIPPSRDNEDPYLRNNIMR
jgi:hypothetical protein